jgi:hypothetical protein
VPTPTPASSASFAWNANNKPLGTTNRWGQVEYHTAILRTNRWGQVEYHTAILNKPLGTDRISHGDSSHSGTRSAQSTSDLSLKSAAHKPSKWWWSTKPVGRLGVLVPLGFDAYLASCVVKTRHAPIGGCLVQHEPDNRAPRGDAGKVINPIHTLIRKFGNSVALKG